MSRVRIISGAMAAAAIGVLILSGKAGAQVPEALVASLLEDCPEGVAETYSKSVPRFVRVLPEKKADPGVTLQAVLPRACYLELQDWQLQTALQLGHYGLNQGLKPSTISDLTEILSWRTLAKDGYLRLGKTYERMLKAGAASEEIAEVFFHAQNEGLLADQTEGYAMLYAENRGLGKNHKDALAAIQPEIAKLKKVRGDKNVMTYAAEVSPAPRARAEGAQPLTGDALWDALENSINKETFTIVPSQQGYSWNADKLEGFFREWKGTPYKWGGVTRKGIDCSGFVIKAIESQFPESKLPRSARDLAGKGTEVDREKLAPGDLVFFAASETPGRITHVGIFVKDQSFAHASSKRGVTLSKIDDKYYARRFVTARRLF